MGASGRIRTWTFAICARRLARRPFEGGEVADRFNFPGPITTSISQESFTSGLVRVSPGAPGWLLDWISQMKIHSDGHRKDAFGTWVSRVDDLALGGAAVRAQLLAAQSRL